MSRCCWGWHNWGCSPSRIPATVTDKLLTHVAADGPNGNFGLEIRNSRDDPDEFGHDPHVARIVVGEVHNPIFTEGILGTAQCLDPGNFETDDGAVASLHFIKPSL